MALSTVGLRRPKQVVIAADKKKKYSPNVTVLFIPEGLVKGKKRQICLSIQDSTAEVLGAKVVNRPIAKDKNGNEYEVPVSKTGKKVKVYVGTQSYQITVPARATKGDIEAFLVQACTKKNVTHYSMAGGTKVLLRDKSGKVLNQNLLRVEAAAEKVAVARAAKGNAGIGTAG
jgi:hypothetical protein